MNWELLGGIASLVLMISAIGAIVGLVMFGSSLEGLIEPITRKLHAGFDNEFMRAISVLGLIGIFTGGVLMIRVGAMDEYSSLYPFGFLLMLVAIGLHRWW